jgi:hypothetical protein
MARQASARSPDAVETIEQQARMMADQGHLTAQELDEVLFSCAIELKKTKEEEETAIHKLQAAMRSHIARKGPAKMAAAAQLISNSLKRFSKVLVCGFEVSPPPLGCRCSHTGCRASHTHRSASTQPRKAWRPRTSACCS